MRIGLFIPCYIDQFYPQVGIATLGLLEKQGLTVSFPPDQTCCGQPLANSGFEHLAKDCTTNFLRNFNNFDYIVCPSGSCTLHMCEQLHQHQESAATEVSHRIFELTQFLTDVLDIKQLDARFPHVVGMHQSCHGLRGLGLAQMSELMAPPFSKPGRLLKMVSDIQLVYPDRPDECCGFGGTFSVFEEAVSVKMGIDCIADHTRQGVEYITGVDMSCLMHLQGILKRQQSPVNVIHIAEILNSKN